MFVVIDK